MKGALRSRESYRHWTRVSTRWHDNDAYGHVNNAVYYQWFDTAVNAWLIEAGLLDVERSDPIGLVVETCCRYAASLAFPRAVDVGLALDRLGTSSVAYHIGIFGEGDSEPAAEGMFTHVYVDRATRRPRPIPAMWRSALEQLR